MAVSRTVACVVEGHGEVAAIPVLVRRLAGAAGVHDLSIPKPFRSPRNRLIAQGPRAGSDLDRVMRLQGERAGEAGLLLVVVDADDDDPADVATVIEEVSSGLVCSTIGVVATREYEAWFLAALRSLQSHPLVRDDATWRDDPEEPRDAKGRLSDRMVTRYKEVLHQPTLTATMSLAEAARATRFDSFQRSFRRWLSGGTDDPG